MRRAERATLRQIIRVLLYLLKGGRGGQHHHHIHEPEPTFSITLGPVRPKKVSTMAEPILVNLWNTQEIDVHPSPMVKLDGKVVKIDGDIVYAVVSGDATIREMDPQEPYAAVLVSGTNGESRITLSGDADLGEGVRTLTREIVLTVTDPPEPEADEIGITLGEPRLKAVVA